MVSWAPQTNLNCPPSTDPPLTDPGDDGTPETPEFEIAIPPQAYCTPAAPTIHSSLVHWAVSTDVGLPSENPVAVWSPRVGVTFTQPVLSRRPKVGPIEINNQKMIKFTASDVTYMDADSELLPRLKKTVIAWILGNTPGNTYAYVNGDGGTANVGQHLNKDFDGTFSFAQTRGVSGSPIYVISNIVPTPLAQPVALTLTWDGTTDPGGVKCFTNQTLTNTQQAISNADQAPFALLRIGADQDPADSPWDGGWGEFIVFEDVLTPTQITAQVCRLFQEWYQPPF